MDEAQKQQRIAELRAKIAQRSQALNQLETQVKSRDSVSGIQFDPASSNDLPPLPKREPGALETFRTHVKDAIKGTPQFLGEVASGMAKLPGQAFDYLTQGDTPTNRMRLDVDRAASERFGRGAGPAPVYREPAPIPDLAQTALNMTVPVAEGISRSFYSSTGLGDAIAPSLASHGLEVPRPISLNEAAGLAGDVAGGFLVGKGLGAAGRVAPPVVARGVRGVADIFNEAPMFRKQPPPPPIPMLEGPPGAAGQLPPAPIYAEGVQAPPSPQAPPQLPGALEVPRLPPSPAEIRLRRGGPDPAPDSVFEVEPTGGVSRMPGEPPVWVAPQNRIPVQEAASTASPMPPGPAPQAPPRPATDFWREQPGTGLIGERPPTQSRPADYSSMENPANRVGIDEALGKEAPPPPERSMLDVARDTARDFGRRSIGAGKRVGAGLRPTPGSAAGGAMVGSGSSKANPQNYLEGATGKDALAAGKEPATPSPERGAEGRAALEPPGKKSFYDDIGDAPKVGEGKRAREGGGASGSRLEAGSARGIPPGEAQGDVPGLRGGSGWLNPDARLPTGGKGEMFDAMTSNWQSPQFNRFLNEVEAVDATYAAGVSSNKWYNQFQESVFGSADRMSELKDFFKKNPAASRAAIKTREGKALTNAEKRALVEYGDEIMPFVDEAFGFIDRVREDILPKLREDGIEVGDLGETYVPYQYRSLGDLIQAMGENWRERFKEPDFSEVILGNLEKHRTPGARMPENMNLAEVMDSYIRQVADAMPGEEGMPSRKLLSREMGELTKDLRKKGFRNEAEVLESYSRANKLSANQSQADMRMLDLKLRELAQEKVEIGSSVESNGRWLPEGSFKVLEQETTNHGRKYRIQYEGETEPRTVSEMDILAAKHADSPMRHMVTDAINKANSFSALLTVAGRMKTFATSMTSNVARTVLSESLENVQKGVEMTLKYRRPKGLGGEFGEYPPELLRELQEQGVRDRSMKSVTENPMDDAPQSRLQELAFKNVTWPDELNKETIYWARKEGLRQRHPDWSEARIRNAAGRWAANYSDMAADGFRSGASITPVGRLSMHLVKSGAREFELFIDNVRRKDYAAAAGQVGMKAAALAAIISITPGGEPEDFVRGLVETVPIVGTAVTRGDAMGWNAVGVIGQRAGKLATGDVEGAAPGFVKQFKPLVED